MSEFPMPAAVTREEWDRARAELLAREGFEAYLREAPVALEEKDMARVRTWLAEPGGSVTTR